MHRLFVVASIPALCLAAFDEPAPSFAVASIKPSRAEVKFEHDGKTEPTPTGVNMQDVTAATCIKWAYEVQDSQIAGPAWLQSEHYDITAKTDGPVTLDQLKLMMRALLADRFQLTFHRQNQASSVICLNRGEEWTQATGIGSRDNKHPDRIRRTAPPQKAITMTEFTNFIARPLQTPVCRYDWAEG